MDGLTVILGTTLQRIVNHSEIRIATPQGDVLLISEGDIISNEVVDASGELRRYTISSNSVVKIETTGASLKGIDATAGTILKWLDDGGTISKSRDDNK